VDSFARTSAGISISFANGSAFSIAASVSFLVLTSSVASSSSSSSEESFNFLTIGFLFLLGMEG